MKVDVIMKNGETIAGEIKHEFQFGILLYTRVGGKMVIPYGSMQRYVYRE